MMKKRNRGMRNVQFLAAAALTAALMAGQIQPMPVHGSSEQIQVSSLIPDNVTIDQPVPLSEISLPGSDYGTLSWVDSSSIPSERVQSYDVVFRPYNSSDLARISGWDGVSDAIYSSVTVVVSNPDSSGESEDWTEDSEDSYTEEGYQDETEYTDDSYDESQAGGEAQYEESQGSPESEGEEAGSDGETEVSVTPEPEETPEITEEPEVNVTPEATPTPEITEKPEVSATPEPEETPAEPEKPEEGEDTPEITETPEKTPTPEITEKPEASVTPEATPTPEITEKPDSEEDKDPEPTPTPEITEAPEVSVTPEPTGAGEKDENIFDRDEDSEKDNRPDEFEDDLTDEEKEAAAEANHSCNGISVSGINLPWYVQFRASSGDNYEFTNETEANIFKSYEFELWDLKNNTEYQVPDGEYISVTVPVKAGYEYTIEHLLDNGAMETIVPSVDGSTMVFSTHSFSPFGIAGSKPLVGEEIATDGYEDSSAAQATTTPAAGSSSAEESGSGVTSTPAASDTTTDTGSQSSAGQTQSSQNDEESNEDSSDSSEAVNTGDSTPIVPFVILAVAAVVIIGVIVYLRKRK